MGVGCTPSYLSAGLTGSALSMSFPAEIESHGVGAGAEACDDSHYLKTLSSWTRSIHARPIRLTFNEVNLTSQNELDLDPIPF